MRQASAGLFRSRQKCRIGTAVDAGRNRCGRNATVDEIGSLDVVAALLLADCGGDVVRYRVGRATLRRTEGVRRVEDVTLFAHSNTRLEVCDLEAIMALLDHFPERHVRRVAVASDVEGGNAERIGLEVE